MVLSCCTFVLLFVISWSVNHGLRVAPPTAISLCFLWAETDWTEFEDCRLWALGRSPSHSGQCKITRRQRRWRERGRVRVVEAPFRWRTRAVKAGVMHLSMLSCWGGGGKPDIGGAFELSWEFLFKCPTPGHLYIVKIATKTKNVVRKAIKTIKSPHYKTMTTFKSPTYARPPPPPPPPSGLTLI